MTEAQLDPRRSEAAYQLMNPDEIDVVACLDVVWRYRWLIVVLCFIAMVATVAWTLTRPRRYAASTTVVPPLTSLQGQSSLVGLGLAGNSMLRGIIDTGSIGEIYVDILQSREVADAIIDRFDFMKVHEGAVTRTRARSLLKRNTKIEANNEGSIKISISDTDRNRCAAIATAYVEQLDKQNKRLSAGEATSKRIFLENRLKEIETRLSNVESTSARDTRNLEALEQLLVEQCEMARIEEAKSMPTIQVLDAAIVPELPVGRGTIRKGILAGVGAFVAAVLLAFMRDYVVAMRRRGRHSVLTGRYDIRLPDSDSSDAGIHPKSVSPVLADERGTAVDTEGGPKLPLSRGNSR